MMVSKYFSGILDHSDSASKITFWVICLLLFLAVLIFLPRFATLLEFAISGVFYYIAMTVTYVVEVDGKLIEKALITNGLGYFVVITLSVFMFMKLVFFVFEVMYRIIFHGEKEPKAYKDDENDIVF